MGFLYGNITNHLPRTNFKFYKVYPNRTLMHKEVEEIPEEEWNDLYIPEGEYLLVDYSSDGNYVQNYQMDLETYCHEVEDDEGNIHEIHEGNFDCTVWQVRYLLNEDKIVRIKCVAVARLHSILPTFETYGSYKIDILESISGVDAFGRGKNIWSIDTISGAPVELK